MMSETEWVKTKSVWIKHLYYLKGDGSLPYQTTVLARLDSSVDQREAILSKEKVSFKNEII